MCLAPAQAVVEKDRPAKIQLECLTRNRPVHEIASVCRWLIDSDSRLLQLGVLRLFLRVEAA